MGIFKNKVFDKCRGVIKNPYLFLVLGFLLIAGINLVVGIIVEVIRGILVVPYFTNSGLGILNDIGIASRKFMEASPTLSDNLELLVTFGLQLLLLLIYVKFIEKSSFSTLGFEKKGMFKKYLVGFLIGVLMITSVTVILLVTGFAQVVNVNISLTSIYYVLLIVPAWLVQSATEEVTVRGFLMNRIGSLKPVFALIVTSSLFSFLHLANANISMIAVLNIFIVGILFGIYAMVTQDLWGACAMHGAWNLFQGSIFGFEVSGQTLGTKPLITIVGLKPDWISGGRFGVEGGVIASIVIIITLIIVVLNYKKIREKFISWS